MSNPQKLLTASERDLSNIHESLRATFIPLPSDPTVLLTPEQLQAVFPNPGAWNEMMALTLQQQQLEAATEAAEPNVA